MIQLQNKAFKYSPSLATSAKAVCHFSQNMEEFAVKRMYFNKDFILWNEIPSLHHLLILSSSSTLESSKNVLTPFKMNLLEGFNLKNGILRFQLENNSTISVDTAVFFFLLQVIKIKKIIQKEILCPTLILKQTSSNFQTPLSMHWGVIVLEINPQCQC